MAGRNRFVSLAYFDRVHGGGSSGVLAGRGTANAQAPAGLGRALPLPHRQQPPPPPPPPPPSRKSKASKKKHHRVKHKGKRYHESESEESSESESEESSEDDEPAKGKLDKKEKEKFCFKTPFRATIVGESGSGKTYWVVNYLLNCDSFDQIVWCGPEHSLQQPILQKLRDRYTKEDEEGNKLEYFSDVLCDAKEGVDVERIEELLKHGHENGWQSLVVFDDCMMIATNKKILELFISGRHLGASVMELQQQIFPPNTRAHRVNSSLFVVFDFGQKSEFANLAKQLCFNKEDREMLCEKYREIVRKGKGHCIIIDKTGPSSQSWPSRVRDTKINCFVPELWDI
jgi:hypothetical protein